MRFWRISPSDFLVDVFYIATFNPKNEGRRLHRHPAFFGTIQECIEDCCEASRASLFRRICHEYFYSTALNPLTKPKENYELKKMRLTFADDLRSYLS